MMPVLRVNWDSTLQQTPLARMPSIKVVPNSCLCVFIGQDAYLKIKKVFNCAVD